MIKKTLTLVLGIALLGADLGAKNAADCCELKAQSPRAISIVTPTYPFAARADGIEGTVMVQCLVAADGKVLAAGSLDQTQPLLSQAAVAALSQWKFASRETENSAPVLVRVPVRFDLEKENSYPISVNIAAN